MGRIMAVLVVGVGIACSLGCSPIWLGGGPAGQLLQSEQPLRLLDSSTIVVAPEVHSLDDIAPLPDGRHWCASGAQAAIIFDSTGRITRRIAYSDDGRGPWNYKILTVSPSLSFLRWNDLAPQEVALVDEFRGKLWEIAAPDAHGANIVVPFRRGSLQLFALGRGRHDHVALVRMDGTVESNDRWHWLNGDYAFAGVDLDGDGNDELVYGSWGTLIVRDSRGALLLRKVLSSGGWVNQVSVVRTEDGQGLAAFVGCHPSEGLVRRQTRYYMVESHAPGEVLVRRIDNSEDEPWGRKVGPVVDFAGRRFGVVTTVIDYQSRGFGLSGRSLAVRLHDEAGGVAFEQVITPARRTRPIWGDGGATAYLEGEHLVVLAAFGEEVFKFVLAEPRPPGAESSSR